MKVFKVIIVTAAFLLVQSVFSQDIELTKKDSIVESSWMVGLGFNAVDDAGSEFSNFLNATDNWNIVPFPSRVSLGRYFKSGLGIEAIGTYNRYKEGKTIDNLIISEDINYYGIDLRFSYDLNGILGHTGFFDPYVGIGVGYTNANNVGRGTYNTLIGFRTWFSDKFGLDFNSTGKWAMSTENATNHIQHAVGVVYRFGIKKGLSKRGEEKLVLIKERQKEQQRVQDSTLAAQRAEEEAKLVAERLKREEEKARLAAEERAKIESKNSKRKEIKDQINALGNVYFDFNSSYLNKESKDVLDKLFGLLISNTEIDIKIEAYTDSRGTEAYNAWLSKRRAKNTVDYLMKKGLDSSRITGEGFGESKLLNDCGNNNPCTEQMHQQNRRSEFLSIVRSNP